MCMIRQYLLPESVRLFMSLMARQQGWVFLSALLPFSAHKYDFAWFMAQRTKWFENLRSFHIGNGIRDGQSPGSGQPVQKYTTRGSHLIPVSNPASSEDMLSAT